MRISDTTATFLLRWHSYENHWFLLQSLFDPGFFFRIPRNDWLKGCSSYTTGEPWKHTDVKVTAMQSTFHWLRMRRCSHAKGMHSKSIYQTFIRNWKKKRPLSWCCWERRKGCVVNVDNPESNQTTMNHYFYCRRMKEKKVNDHQLLFVIFNQYSTSMCTVSKRIVYIEDSSAPACLTAGRTYKMHTVIIVGMTMPVFLIDEPRAHGFPIIIFN